MCGAAPYPRAARAPARRRAVAAAGALLILAGCSTPPLEQARALYYRGDFEGSAAALGEVSESTPDLVLVLMERGMANQARAHYADSIEDWLRAKSIADYLDYFSVSRQSASMVVNDTLLAFRGAPYERALLHAMAAQSFMALGLWQESAVEARNIIRRLEDRGDYPDDPFSRYVAALALELSNDPQGADFQYRQAAKLAKRCSVDAATGQLGPAVVSTNAEASAAPDPAAPADAPRKPVGPELICLVGIGHGPSGGRAGGANWRWGGNPYAEFYANGRFLGRSHTLATTDELLHATEQVTALRDAAKTATRVAIKEAAAQALSQQNEALGDLLRLALFALETDDRRMWETLPQWLGAARLPCPRGLQSFEVVFRSGGGDEIERRTVTAPIAHQADDTITFLRAL